MRRKHYLDRRMPFRVAYDALARKVMWLGIVYPALTKNDRWRKVEHENEFRGAPARKVPEDKMNPPDRITTQAHRRGR